MPASSSWFYPAPAPTYLLDAGYDPAPDAINEDALRRYNEVAQATIDPRLLLGEGNLQLQEQAEEFGAVDLAREEEEEAGEYMQMDDYQPDEQEEGSEVEASDVEPEEPAKEEEPVPAPPLRRSRRLAAAPGPSNPPAPQATGNRGTRRKPLSNTQSGGKGAKSAKKEAKAPRKVRSSGTKVKENELVRPTRRAPKKQWHCQICNETILDEPKTRSRHTGSVGHRREMTRKNIPLPEIAELKCPVCNKVFSSNRHDSLRRHRITARH